MEESERVSVVIDRGIHERLRFLKGVLSAREGRTLSWDDLFARLLKREEQKKRLISWLYTIGIFIGITFVLLFPIYVGAPRMVPLSLFIGLIVALFSVYVLTPWTLRDTRPFEEPSSALPGYLEELSTKAAMRQKPRLMILETPEINAMAYASIQGNRVCVTRGLLDSYESGRLDEGELKAILAHEIGHIRNQDCLKRGLVLSWVSIFEAAGTFCTIAGTAVSGIGIAVGEASTEEGAGWVARLFGWWLVITGVAMKMMAKVASIPAFHLSRRQEHAADEVGAEIASPENMANALGKLEQLDHELIAGELASLPYADRWQLQPRNPSWVDGLFDTHPPTGARCGLLRRIGESL